VGSIAHARAPATNATVSDAEALPLQPSGRGLPSARVVVEGGRVADVEDAPPDEDGWVDPDEDVFVHPTARMTSATTSRIPRMSLRDATPAIRGSRTRSLQRSHD